MSSWFVRLDRLARSVRDLLNILERFGQDDVGFVSLREKHIDTTSAGGRLVLNIMASIAEFERELIQSRMVEGRRRACRTSSTRSKSGRRSPGSRRARASP
jgi:DNA invertase Pin-like site-specific DNA recombinase